MVQSLSALGWIGGMMRGKVKVDGGKIGVGVGHLDVECHASVEKGTFWRGLSIAGRKVEGSPLREAGMGPFQSLGWAPPC